ncbi:MAG: hypothetical protein AB7R89_30930 [Dehalococcoidia bacterium]
MKSRAMHLDLAPIETRPGRFGWRLRCPVCRRWASHLVILGGGMLVCRRCRPSTKKGKQ